MHSRNFLGKYRKICRKALTLSYKRKLRHNNKIFTKVRIVDTQRGRSRAGSFNTDLANLGARVVPGPGVKFREVARKLKMTNV